MKFGTLGFIIGAIVAWTSSKLLPFAIAGLTAGAGYAIFKFVLNGLNKGYCTL